MSRLSRNVIDGFNAAEDIITEQAKVKLAKALKAYIEANAALFYEEGGRARLLDEITELVTAITKSSALLTSNLSAKYYDYIRATCLDSFDFKAQQLSDYDTEGTVTYIRMLFGDMESADGADDFVDGLSQRLGYDMKRAAGNTIYHNGFNDTHKTLYARIPAPGSKCEFCAMLASRGFVYRSAKTAGQDEHYHANCHCRITPNWELKQGQLSIDVDGYDPDAIYEEWKNTDHADYMYNRKNRSKDKNS